MSEHIMIGIIFFLVLGHFRRICGRHQSVSVGNEGICLCTLSYSSINDFISYQTSAAAIINCSLEFN